MASIDQKMAASLRRTEAIVKALRDHFLGAQPIDAVLESAGSGFVELVPRTDKGQVYPIDASMRRLVIVVYALAATPAPKAKEGEDAKAKSTAKSTAKLSAEARTRLPDGSLYVMADDATTKACQLELVLDICPDQFDLVINVDGDAEFAVFGI